jgi:ATP-dependent DNA helicase RecG
MKNSNGRFDSNRLKVWIRDIKIYIAIYPLKMDFKDLMDGFTRLPLPDYSISILHGKMKPADKDAEMKRSRENYGRSLQQLLKLE